MPAPLAPTYSPAALYAANTAFRDLLDAGAGAGSILIRSAADALLAQVPLTKPCGTVNVTTGQLTITLAGIDEAANASGAAAYGQFCDSNNTPHMALPVLEGAAPVPGFLVMNSTTVVVFGTVEVLSVLIG